MYPEIKKMHKHLKSTTTVLMVLLCPDHSIHKHCLKLKYFCEAPWQLQ